MNYDIAIIGGGIVGAATLYKLQRAYPQLSIVLFEKEDKLAAHQTGNNSGVIHSGLYYKPGSLKAKNCVSGRHELVKFAKDYNVSHDVCGKVVVATKQSEFKFMDEIFVFSPRVISIIKSIFRSSILFILASIFEKLYPIDE